MNIQIICEALIVALYEAGYKRSTIFNYEGVIRRFTDFCNVNNITKYTPSTGEIYANDVISLKTGKFSYNRYYSQGRFIRFLDSYYNYGAFNFEPIKLGTVKPTNYNHSKIYDDYKQFLLERYSNKNTIHFYEYELYYFLQYLNSVKIYNTEKIASVTVINYYKFVKQSRQRAASCGLRLFFKYIERNDLYSCVQGIKTFRSQRIIPILTDDEQERLKKVIESGKTSRRDAAIILLGLSTGIRACDLIKLKLSDINWSTETLTFKQSKTGNTVCLPFTITVGNSLARYIFEERPKTTSKFLFIRQLAPYGPLSNHATCYSIVKKVFDLANISKENRIFGMHMLRHNSASTMIKNEVPIGTIAAILGHSNTDTTDVYITTDDKKLKECVLPMNGISKEVNI